MDSALAKRMAQQAAKAAGDGSDDDDDDDVQACDNYRVDLQAKNFGDCKCGFPKFSHKEKPKPVGRAAFQKKEQQAEGDAVRARARPAGAHEVSRVVRGGGAAARERCAR